MLSTKCNLCSGCDTFGFRSRETFNVNNSLGCTCIILEKDTISSFLSLMKSRGLLVDLTCEQVPTRERIQNELSNMTYSYIIKELENDDVLQGISQNIFNIIKKVNGTVDIYPWEYLDVRCGTGRVSREIARKLKVMTQHTDIKDNRIGKFSHKEYEDFLIFDGSNLPHEDDMYSVVTCLTVLHRTESPAELIKSINRILKPGGILIIREFNCRSWNDAYSLDFMHQVLSDQLSEDTAIVNYRSKEGWRKLIINCGFKLLKDQHKPPPKWCSYNMYFDVFQKPTK